MSSVVARIRKEAADAIKALADKRKGRITPAEVVAEAESPDSPLHQYFEWDDSEAASKYRLDQARSLIRSVEVVYTVESKQVYSVGYVRDPDQAPNEAGYISVSKVKSNTDAARDVLLAEFGRVGSALKRAKSLAAVLGMAEEIESLDAQVRTLTQRAMATANEGHQQAAA